MAGPHGILVGAEQGKPIGGEILQGFRGLLPRDGPVEVPKAPGMPGKEFTDDLQNLAGDLVGGEGNGYGDLPGPFFSKPFRFSVS